MRTVQFAVVAFAIAAFSIAASLSLAQTTLEKQIPIKGKLTNVAGTPLEGKYTFEFEIFDASTEGNSLWSETKQISVAKGIWSTNLGSATALPSSIATENQLYLEITVNSKKLTPRSALYTGLTSRDLTLPNSIGAPEIKADYGILSKITGGLFTLVNNVFNFGGSLSTSGTVTASKLVGNASSGNAIEAYGTVVVKNSPTSTSGTINIGSGSIAYTGSAWTISPGLTGANIQDNSITRSKVSTSFIQAGKATITANQGAVVITYPTPFSSTPYTVCSAKKAGVSCAVDKITEGANSFKALIRNDAGTAPDVDVEINWIAIGT